MKIISRRKLTKKRRQLESEIIDMFIKRVSDNFSYSFNPEEVMLIISLIKKD